MVKNPDSLLSEVHGLANRLEKNGKFNLQATFEQEKNSVPFLSSDLISKYK